MTSPVRQRIWVTVVPYFTGNPDRDGYPFLSPHTGRRLGHLWSSHRELGVTEELVCEGSRVHHVGVMPEFSTQPSDEFGQAGVDPPSTASPCSPGTR
jgi:hypothetical protein